jgi:aspartyl-tRNA(Asn)/glutamyl-tRNA(Gln) amidotransferase subunit A
MMHLKTIRELRAALDQKQVSSVELTQHYLQRIQAHNPTINAFITTDAEKSLAQAKAADAKLANGERSALLGIPIAHKDIFCAEGWRSTCGSKMLADFISPYDAHVITQFNHAGAINLGKTNCDEFAMGSSNENSYFGPVKNPWDTTTVPGGSSGGSAASVAARLCPAATATDTGGSIRQPASFTGTTGIKPTYGVVSRYGMVAYASSLDQGGVIAQTAADCADLLNIMSTYDARDSTCIEGARKDFAADLEQPLKGLRIGVPDEYFGDGVDADVLKAIEAALAQYTKLGATIVKVKLPLSKLAIPAYYVIAPAEASSNLARFDGVRYGHRAANYKDLKELYEKSRAEGFGSEVQRRILTGAYVLSQGYFDAYYLQAQRIRRLIANDFKAALSQCDIIAGPAAPTTAFKLGANVTDPVKMYLGDIFTVSINLAGLPALSHPVGFDSQGRTVGLQLIGNYLQEAKMLNAAHQFQRETDWHTRAPAAFV